MNVGHDFDVESPFGKNHGCTKPISLYEKVFTIKLLLFPTDYNNAFIVLNERFRVGAEL